MDAMPVKQGDVLAGKYRVDRILGAGGMGVVVAATHLELLEPVALKFILPSALESGDAASRFLREARAAARLKNEHVARVHDVGRLENGAPYMVMDYLEGNDLDAIVKRNGPVSPANAALYAIQVCEALAEAHSLGIIHRDIKPSNLFLARRPDGSPSIKVLDFGISKMTGTGPEFEMTKTEAMLGSPSYMSPEQMRSARSVDARTDIWSLGVILYKLITGKLPFRAQTITELITMVLEASPEPPSSLRSEVSPILDAVILTCLRRNRDERYPNVAALAAALAPFAPPGAGASIESMSRILASSPSSAQLRSGIHPAPAAPSPADGQTPSQALSPELGTPAAITPAPAALSRAAEPTNNSWGRTSRLRSHRRAGVPLLVAGAAAFVGLAVGLCVTFLRNPPSPTAASGTSVRGALAAPGQETLPAPSAAQSSAPSSPPSMPSVEPLSVATASSGAPTSSARAAAEKLHAPAAVGKPASNSRAAPVPKEETDPFGSGRK